MYIGFKWLVGITSFMWITLCFLDLIVKQTKIAGHATEIQKQVRNLSETKLYRNNMVESLPIIYYFANSIYFFMVLSGALLLMIFDKKSTISISARTAVMKLRTSTLFRKIRIAKYFKNTTPIICVPIGVISLKLWKYTTILKSYLLKVITSNFLQGNNNKCDLINILLCKKLVQVNDERKKLRQLLIIALNENKNIRIKYKLEAMTKNRLANYIENSHQIIQENQSKYVSFQHLYLISHQENKFLKARIKKIICEKEETEKNFTRLVNEVYCSKSNELKDFCSRFSVKSRKNLLNSDIKTEIQKFLKKYNETEPTPSAKLDRNNSLIALEESLNSLADAPKLRGLPGEIIWTVKDKDGLIEKLYEYEFQSEIDNRDITKRIRQYSVYYDKDCLLDNTNSRTIIHESKGKNESFCLQHRTRNFLTSSEQFRSFLELNKCESSPPNIPAIQ